MTDQTITLTLKADASGMVKVVGSAVDGVKTKLAQAGSATDAWKRQLGQIGNVAKAGFAALAAGAAAAGAGMALMVRNSINAADAIAEASERTGVAVEQLSKLDYAAKLSGTSFESVEKALTKLSREADAGGANLARLGVSAVDSSGKMRPVNDLFLEVSDRFSEMGSAAEKSAAAQAIFGKAGAELVPLLSQGRDGIAALGDEAERLGVVISGDTANAAATFNDNIDKLAASGEGLANSLTSALMPTLLDLSSSAVEYGQSLVAAERESGIFQTAVEAMAAGLKVGLVALVLVKNALDAFVTTVIGAVDIVATSFGGIGRIIGTVAASIRDALKAAFDMDAAGVKTAIGGIGKEVEAILTETTSRIAASGGAIATEWADSVGDVTNTIDALFLKYEDGAAASKNLAGATDDATKATRSLGASSKVAAEAEKLRTEALKSLQSGLEKLAGITQDYERQLAGPVQQAMMDYEAAQQAITAAADEALPALTALGGGVEAQAQVYAAEERALDLAAQAHERLTRAAEVEMANRTQFASVADAGLADLQEETRQLQLTHVERVTEAALLAASTQAQKDYVLEKRNTINVSAAEIAAIRAGAAAQVEGQNQIIAAQDAASESQSTMRSGIGNLSTAVADFALGGIKSFKDFGDAALNIARQTLADIIAMFLRNKILVSVGMSGSGVAGAASAAAGSGGGAIGGAGSMLGSLLGGAGALVGGGLGTGLLASASIFSGAGLLGGITGSIGAGVASIAGGAFMQGVGLLLGPVGLIVGAVAALTQIFGEDQETILRVRSQQFNGDRRARGVAESDLGSIFVRGESLGDGAAVEIAGRIKDFDNLIAGLLNDDQLAAVRERLSEVNDTFRNESATVGEALDARFGAILGELSADVVAFVGTAGELEDRVGRLAEALQIESLVDLGTLGDTFGEVAALIEEYRVGTEEIGATYTRLIAGAEMFEAALGIAGLAFDGTRQELIRFAADITEAAGGLERAQSLWAAYFETFYTADERAAYALQQARANAAAQASDIGLELATFDTEGGAAQFRELFESMLPTLSAEAVVEWLEFADALGIIIGMSGEAAEVVQEFGETLADIMAEVGSQLADFAGPATFAERIAAVNDETATLIDRATALGATETQLAQIRELGAARLGEILDEQASALANYQSLVQGVRDELADASGASDFQREMREINRALAETVTAMNEAARAAGMQGAAESDLAAAHELAAIRAARAIARLQERGRDIVQQLYGSPLERLEQQIAEIEAGIGGFAGGVTGGMEQVAQATDSAVQAQLGAQERIRDWLDQLMLGDLGGLRPRDALVEAQALFDRTLASALGGDAEAMAALPGLSDQLLRLGQQVYASGGDYFNLRDTIRDALEQVAGLQIDNPTPTGGGGSIGGDGNQSGDAGGDLAALQAQRAELLAQQAAAERLALATELTGIIRDLVIATGDPLADIAAGLGISMSALVTDLGVNLDTLTSATAGQLADIAQAMGAELTELAGSVGADLGALSDAQSLMNDALEAEIAALPEGQRAALESLLRDIEEAAALGDTAGVERGIGDMEAAINDLAPDLRDALAPFFANVNPADPTTELAQLQNIGGGINMLVSEAATHSALLLSIANSVAGNLQPGPILGDGLPGTGPIGTLPPPGYAVGTPWVPADGLAYLHRGEAVIPARVNAALRGAGVSGGTDQNLLVAELRELRRERREADEYTRRLEQRLAALEATTREAGRAQTAATDRQTDALKLRSR